MNDFDFLNNAELSHILNKKEFGIKLQNQILLYCNKKGKGHKNIQALLPSWEERNQRINIERTETSLNISKTRRAKGNKLLDLIILIAITLLVLALVFGAIWNLLSFWGLPFYMLIIYLFISEGKNWDKETSYPETLLRISKPFSVQAFEDGVKKKEKNIVGVYLFWDVTDLEYSIVDVEAHLELRVSEKWSITIDSSSNYLELLRIGNQIAIASEKKLNVIQGKTDFWPIFQL